MGKKIFIACVAVLVVLGAGVWILRHTLTRLAERATLPEETPYATIATSTPAVPLPHATPFVRSATPMPIPVAQKPTINNDLPIEVNLAVPFTPQAPHANWDDPYGDFCEEASVLMAISYLQHKEIPNATFADAVLLGIKEFEDTRFGYNKDTNAEETAVILREHFSYSAVELKQNPTLQDIKQAVAAGRVVIVPVAGRELKNPYFQSPGPLYHMIVIKGYTASGKFITHDPGTRRGADFLYDQQLIMNAMHDWRTDGNIMLGKKVVIIAG